MCDGPRSAESSLVSSAEDPELMGVAEGREKERDGGRERERRHRDTQKQEGETETDRERERQRGERGEGPTALHRE